MLYRLLAIFLVFAAVPAIAMDLEQGQSIELEATHPDGVPLHKRSENSMKGRVPDGSVVEIRALTEGTHWIKIRLEDGKEGWITDRYVKRIVSAQPVVGTAADDVAAVWTSSVGCEEVIAGGGRMAPQTSDKLRMGAWNIRWFPDTTNIQWTACTIAWMNVDVLALEEIRRTEAGRQALNFLLIALEERTGDTWAQSFQECGSAGDQHVGFIWNTSRVAVSGDRDLWHLNDRGTPEEPCKSRMRAGRYAYFTSTAVDGVDFGAIAVHLKMGAAAAEQARRNTSLNQIDDAFQDVGSPDADAIVLGDFNTMGTGSRPSAQLEIEALASTAAALDFDRLELEPYACTEYYKGHGGWLDHALVSEAMEEVLAPSFTITGYCALHECENIPNWYGSGGAQRPAAYRELSDHCPVVFEISNQDLD